MNPHSYLNDTGLIIYNIHIQYIVDFPLSLIHFLISLLLKKFILEEKLCPNCNMFRSHGYLPQGVRDCNTIWYHRIINEWFTMEFYSVFYSMCFTL